MRYSKAISTFALAAGMALAGASALPAQDWRGNGGYGNGGYGNAGSAARQEYREDMRDTRHDFARIDPMRAQIARDQARLQEDMRCRRFDAVKRDRLKLSRDQRALGAMQRDARYERRDLNADRFSTGFRR